MSSIRKIWHDPVGSKVIATGIIGLLTLVGSFVASLFGSMNFIDILMAILSFHIPLWICLVIVFVILIMYGMYKKTRMKHNKENEITRYKNPFITFNNESTDQRYCANCWEKDGRKVQLTSSYYNTFECPICKTVGNFSELDEKPKTYPYQQIYRF